MSLAISHSYGKLRRLPEDVDEESRQKISNLVVKQQPLRTSSRWTHKATGATKLRCGEWKSVMTTLQGVIFTCKSLAKRTAVPFRAAWQFLDFQHA